MNEETILLHVVTANDTPKIFRKIDECMSYLELINKFNGIKFSKKEHEHVASYIERMCSNGAIPFKFTQHEV